MRAPRDIERVLRRNQAPELDLAARGAACAAIVAVPGLLGAGLAAALVVGLFALSGLALACVARRSPATLPAVSFVGAIVRMIAYGALLTALAGVDDIDRASTAIATCLLLIVTLAYEARFAATAPGYYWLQTPAPHGAQVNERTRG